MNTSKQQPETSVDPIAEWDKLGALGWSAMLLRALGTPGNYLATSDDGSVVEFQRAEVLGAWRVRLHGVGGMPLGEEPVLDVRPSDLRTIVEGKRAVLVSLRLRKPGLICERKDASEAAKLRELQEVILDRLVATGGMESGELMLAVGKSVESRGLKWDQDLYGKALIRMLGDDIEASGTDAHCTFRPTPPPDPREVKDRAWREWLLELAGRDLEDVTLLATTNGRAGTADSTALIAALCTVFHARYGSPEERFENTRDLAAAWYRVRPMDGVPGRLSSELARSTERLKLGAQDFARTGRLPDSFQGLAVVPSDKADGEEPPTVH